MQEIILHRNDKVRYYSVSIHRPTTTLPVVSHNTPSSLTVQLLCEYLFVATPTVHPRASFAGTPWLLHKVLTLDFSYNISCVVFGEIIDH